MLKRLKRLSDSATIWLMILFPPQRRQRRQRPVCPSFIHSHWGLTTVITRRRVLTTACQTDWLTDWTGTPVKCWLRAFLSICGDTWWSGAPGTIGLWGGGGDRDRTAPVDRNRLSINVHLVSLSGWTCCPIAYRPMNGWMGVCLQGLTGWERDYLLERWMDGWMAGDNESVILKRVTGGVGKPNNPDPAGRHSIINHNSGQQIKTQWRSDGDDGNVDKRRRRWHRAEM